MYVEESIWSKGLRIAAWINFGVGIGVGFATARNVGLAFGEPARWGEPAQMSIFMFLVTFIASVILTFLVTAVIMLFLDMARDISITNYHSSVTSQNIAEIKQILARNHSNANVSKTPLAPFAAPTKSTEPKKTVGEGEWQCSACDHINVTASGFCKKCKMSRW